MINDEFYWKLELKISQLLENTKDKKLKGFWCDGILPPQSDMQLSQKYVNDNRQMLMTAFVGADGQDKFELVLHFGPKALSRYARGLNLEDCLPTTDLEERLEINAETKRINILLD